MRFKNVHPFGDIDIPSIRQVVAAGAVFDVPDELAEGFALQPTNFAPTDQAAKDIVKKLGSDEAEDTEGDNE